MERKNNPILDIMSILLILDLAEKTAMMDTLRNNLDTLAKRDREHPDRVDITLTKSKEMLKFGRVFGKWGLLTTDGDWTDLENVPLGIVEEAADYVQQIVNNQ
jgi:hypothetical protein